MSSSIKISALYICLYILTSSMSFILFQWFASFPYIKWDLYVTQIIIINNLYWEWPTILALTATGHDWKTVYRHQKLCNESKIHSSAFWYSELNWAFSHISHIICCIICLHILHTITSGQPFVGRDTFLVNLNNLIFAK